MTLGCDQAIAEAAVRLEIPFLAAVPFPGQEEGWSRYQHDQYHRLLGEAVQSVQVIGRHTDKTAAYKARNRWMVDQLDKEHDMLLALFDGRHYGGTWHSVWYAQGKGVAVRNLWRSWAKHK